MTLIKWQEKATLLPSRRHSASDLCLLVYGFLVSVQYSCNMLWQLISVLTAATTKTAEFLETVIVFMIVVSELSKYFLEVDLNFFSILKCELKTLLSFSSVFVFYNYNIWLVTTIVLLINIFWLETELKYLKINFVRYWNLYYLAEPSFAGAIYCWRVFDNSGLFWKYNDQKVKF